MLKVGIMEMGNGSWLLSSNEWYYKLNFHGSLLNFGHAATSLPICFGCVQIWFIVDKKTYDRLFRS